jgi:hypothetical protein
MQVITNEFTLFVTTFNMDKQPLVMSQLHHWLPMPGTVDMLVVGVQHCDYKVPPRAEEWMAEARRALLSSSRLGGGRVHFDFLATLVNYLGPTYKFIGACVCEQPPPSLTFGLERFGPDRGGRRVQPNTGSVRVRAQQQHNRPVGECGLCRANVWPNFSHTGFTTCGEP